MLFRDCWLEGERCDLRVLGSQIDAIGPAHTIQVTESEPLFEGGLLCSHFAEPHVHLDATQLGHRRPNRSGTLREGITNWSLLRDELTREDVIERASQTVRWYVAQGTTRLRTHVDTGSAVAASALLELRDVLARGVPGLLADGQPVPVELQIVAFPQEGILRAPGRSEAWREVVQMGVDAVGAIPHFERTQAEGEESLRMTLDLASRRGLRVDVHCDETDDPGSRFLEVLCAETADRRMSGQVVAGHCTAMHSYPNPHAAKVIELVVESGVQVITNPLDNVVLQGRYGGYPRVRGLTRVDELWDAGARVGIGHDSVVDPWYGMGTASMLDPAYMAIHLGHLTSEKHVHRTLRALIDDNHLPFGEAPIVVEGAVADLLWFDAHDPLELFRKRPLPTVLSSGRRLDRPREILSEIGRI
jgi:cytosine deaminase